MENEDSVPCLQQPAADPHPGPNESNLQPHTCFCKIHLNIIFASVLRLPRVFPSGFVTNFVPVFHLPYACCLLTNCMEQSPSWDANSRSASQEIICLQWNTKVHYCVHKSPPVVTILSWINPVHTLLTYFSMIHSYAAFWKLKFTYTS